MKSKPPSEDKPFGDLCSTDEEAVAFIESEMTKFPADDEQSRNYRQWLQNRLTEIEARMEAT